MARLHDSSGRLLGGLNSIATPERANSAPVPRSTPPLKPKFGTEETIPGLECSYGTLPYSYAGTPPDIQNVTMQDWRRGCHSPVEDPDERHHCDVCGGDYCTLHAEPAAHDCEYFVKG